VVQFAGLNLHSFALLCVLFATFAVKEDWNRKDHKAVAKSRKDKAASVA
jgi:hypothetical protein